MKNQNGMAMIETLPILVVFMVLIGYMLGFFGVIHTAIMNAMASRNYAFETFRNRSDLNIFRDVAYSETVNFLYKPRGARFHAITSELNMDDSLGSDVHATTRFIDYRDRNPAALGSVADHNQNIYKIQGRNRKNGGVSASPAWVMVGVGICITADCGG